MPNYDFRCDACTAEFEVTRKVSAAREPADCPACGTRARRVFNAIPTGGQMAEPPDPSRKPAAGGWSHFGHSHGPGSAGHSHGAPAPAST